MRKYRFTFFAFILFLLLMLFLGPQIADAESLFCGNSLISPGDTKVDVLEKCGQPLLIEILSGSDEQKIEQWFYRTGPRKFQRLLTFKGFKLTRIETITH